MTSSHWEDSQPFKDRQPVAHRLPKGDIPPETAIRQIHRQAERRAAWKRHAMRQSARHLLQRISWTLEFTTHKPGTWKKILYCKIKTQCPENKFKLVYANESEADTNLAFRKSHMYSSVELLCSSNLQSLSASNKCYTIECIAYYQYHEQDTFICNVNRPQYKQPLYNEGQWSLAYLYSTIVNDKTLNNCNCNHKFE